MSHSDTDQLLNLAAKGDSEAIEHLFQRFRRRLKDMASVRLDPRILHRVDPSDVVQDTLIEAHRRLPQYLKDRPIPFYPWLRGIAWNRLIDLHRRHVRSKRRAVDREIELALRASSQTTNLLLRHWAEIQASPLQLLENEEMLARLQRTLNALNELDREVLILRHLELLSVSETAAVLNVPEGTVKSRHFRALERLRIELAD